MEVLARECLQPEVWGIPRLQFWDPTEPSVPCKVLLQRYTDEEQVRLGDIISDGTSGSERARKFKKVQAKKLV